MRTLIILVLLLLLAGGGLFAGDYANVPLWPINVLNRTYQMEIQCKIDDFDPTLFQSIVGAEQGITIAIQDSRHRPVRQSSYLEMKTDSLGIFRIHLPEGSYYVRAEILAYDRDQLFHFATGSPDQFVRVDHGPDQKATVLTLKRLDLHDFDIMQAKLERLVRAGNIITAKVFIDETLQSSPDMSELNRQHLRDQSRVMKSLIEKGQQVLSLQETQYLSRYRLLLDMQDAFAKLITNLKPRYYQIRLDSVLLNIPLSIADIKDGLNKIASDYMRDMDRFMEIRRYEKVYQFWLYLTGNPELYDETLAVYPEELKTHLVYYNDKIDDIKHRIVRILENLVEKGREYYDARQLDQAYSSFFRCRSIHEEFGENLELTEEFLAIIDSYLHDIQIIRLAQHHIDVNDVTQARELYDQVINESQWLRVVKTDLTRHN